MSQAGSLFNTTGGLVIDGPLSTAPPASSVVTAAFGNSMSDNVSKQNTLGYDIVLNITVIIASAVTGLINLGVGPLTNPGVNFVAITSSLSINEEFTFTAYVPNNYWVLVNSSGVVLIQSISVQAMGV